VVSLPAATFVMGDDSEWSYPEDGEGPTRVMQVDALTLDALAVSNERFAVFVEQTGYVTDAETYAWSFVFAGFLPDDFEDTRGVAAAPWWRQVHGASWRHPEGPHSDIASRLDHPVVQVSARDAAAFAAWAGKRLPTEAEWECAARGGVEGARYPWGDERPPDDGRWVNGPERAGRGAPNGYGLHDVCTNVHEWCNDWYGADSYALSPPRDPRGPAVGTRRVSRGGSWRHQVKVSRCAARSSIPPAFRYADYGFRIACGPD